jgi:hypothetical protein
MKYETKWITIGTWRGPAYLIDGVWYVRPQYISDDMGLPWRHCRQTVVRRFASSLRHVTKVGGMGGRQVVMLPVDATVQWLCAFAGNMHMPEDRRETVLAMAAAIGAQFADWALASATDPAKVEITPVPTKPSGGLLGWVRGKVSRHG